MKKLFAVVLVALLTGSYSYAAQAEKENQSSAKVGANADAKSQGQVNAQPGSVTLDAGSQINAEMASTLDLKKAKSGDPFKMKTTRPVKRDGKEVISRGSTITGHVDQVTRADNTTKATLVFDQLEDKKTHLTSTLSAVVTAVSKVESNASAMSGEDTMATTAPQTRAQQSSSQQSGGGLLGGVNQTVGGVTQTVGGIAGSVDSTVSSTTNATLGANSGVTGAAGGLTRGAIQIVSDATTKTTSGSTLAMAGRNAKIESGTQFVLQTTWALTLTKEEKQK
jgi:hypothetical protein